MSPLRQVRDFTSRPRRRPAARLAPGTPQCAAGLAGRPAAEEAAREAARTAPPRENGGNQDIKNLTRGARIFLPVFVDGGKLSAGDLHFSQGDGEITFCGAIEMGGYLDLRIDLIKDGMQTCGVTSNPVFIPGNVEPRYSEFLTFVGRARSPRFAYEKAGNGFMAGSSPAHPTTARASIPAAVEPTYTFHRRRASSRTVAPRGSISPRSRKLALQQPPAAHPQARQHRDRQDDDPHAPEPMRELPPELHRLPERLDVREHGRAGGGETGHRLEVGVDRVAQLLDPAKQE